MALLEVNNLRTEFAMRDITVAAVDDVSFVLNPGECLGIVGESGCGKTTTGLSVMRLLPRNGKVADGNIIFDGTTPAAVLDWEMVTLGSPEMDLGWSIFLDRHHSEGLEVPRLEGFPSYAETVARYEALSGHRVRHLEYYQVFAGFRFAVIMARIAQQMVIYGVMDEPSGREFELNNTVTRLLAKLLDLPSPAATTG